MIKNVNEFKGNSIHIRTDFIADGADDITAANAEGSIYLKYPAGSTILDAANKKVYVLDASRTAYKEQ